MMKLRSLVLLVTVAALVVAVFAPAAFAGSAGVKMKLSGPRRRYSTSRVSTWLSSIIIA